MGGVPDCGGKCYNPPRPFFPTPRGELTNKALCTRRRDAAEAKRLIDNGADVNGAVGSTPATAQRGVKVTKWLKTARMSIRKPRRRYAFALGGGAKMRRSDLTTAQRSVENNDDWTPLIRQFCELLIDNGADNAKNNGKTPLHTAAEANAVAFVKMLIDNGIHRTPLASAAGKLHIGVYNSMEICEKKNIRCFAFYGDGKFVGVCENALPETPP